MTSLSLLMSMWDGLDQPMMPGYTRNPPLYNAIQAGGIDGDKFIIGDSAYPLSNHMVVPFRDNGHLTVDQRQYNTIVSSQRQAVISELNKH